MTKSKQEIDNAARDYIEAGLSLVQWKKARSKGPRTKGWNEEANAIDDPAKLNGAAGIGLAHLWSRTCSLDVDDFTKAEKYFADKDMDLKAILEDAVRISSGRKNRAKAIFNIPAVIDPLDLITINDQANGFELRCCSKNGLTVQDVLPPTVHPNGKKYEWKGDWKKLTDIPTALICHWIYRTNEVSSFKYENQYNDMLEPIIRDAVFTIDPDIDYDTWLRIGMALDYVGLEHLWDEWSSNGDGYKPGDCEARCMGFSHRGENLVGVGTVFHHAKEAGWKRSESWRQCIDWIRDNVDQDNLREIIDRVATLKRLFDADDADMAMVAAQYSGRGKMLSKKEFLSSVHKALNDAYGGQDFNSHREIAVDYSGRFNDAEIISTGFRLYRWLDYWRPKHNRLLEQEVQTLYEHQPLCRTHPQVKQVGEAIHAHLFADGFFSGAPAGIATPDGFYFLDKDGKVKNEPNKPTHRQLAFAPVTPADGKPKLFNRHLKSRIGFETAQIDLFWEIMGAILFRQMYRYQKAVVLYGDSNTGKSTVLNVIESFFKGGEITHMPPNKMSNEYYSARLDGSVLNTFHELPDGNDIASIEFKSIVGGEPVDVRQIRQGVTELRCTASHLFSTNTIPDTSLTDDSWYNRFLVIEFRNPVSLKKLDVDFGEKLEQELPQIMTASFRGIERLIANDGKFTPTQSHKAFITNWKHANNQVKQFLSDSDWVTLKPGARETRRSGVWSVYKEWARDHERKLMRKSEFFAELEKIHPFVDVKGVGIVVTGILVDIPFK